MNTSIDLNATQSTKDLYRELIRRTLIENNVVSICRDGTRPTMAENFFDKIILHADGTLTVFRHGMQLDNFYFDFTNDFARCLSYIEDAIFCEARHMEVTDRNYHGLTVEFAR